MSETRNKFKSGQVVKINLGNVNANEITGHEQGEVRPCVVIKSLHRIGLLIIVPFTSKKPKNPNFYLVPVTKDDKCFIYDSYALCHQIRTVSVDRIIEDKACKLSSQDFNKIKIVLMDLLELE